MKKLLTLTGDVTMIVKLQAFFEFETKYFPRMAEFILGTFWTITLGAYDLLGNALILNQRNSGNNCFSWG